MKMFCMTFSILFMTLHFFACVWIFIGTLTDGWFYQQL
jgi:hypothetical protein